MHFNTKLVGVSFRGRQNNIEKVHPPVMLFWKHESNNKYDSNAILVCIDHTLQRELGHLSRAVARRFVELISNGQEPAIFAEQVTGEGKLLRGINVRIVYSKVKSDL